MPADHLTQVDSDVYDGYDQVPYPHRAFPQTHPDTLATVATVFGLTPPPVTTARVLELGCGSGGNLIPMAEALPDARFVGIDLSARHVDTGRAVVRSLRLGNIDLRRQGIGDFADPGEFDYVIAHGVYSWVRPDVRRSLLDACARVLSPSGVAYVSYNAFPGWHLHGMLRDLLRHHAHDARTPAERIAKAKELLDFLSAAAPLEGGPTGSPLAHTFGGAWGHLLKGVADAVRALPDATIFHDHLGSVNQPFYFREFVADAAAAGLQYLGEAQPEMMSTAALGKEVDPALRRVAGDWIDAEQYLDVVRNRPFRQTLLVRADAKLHRQIDPAWVRGLWVGSPTEPVPEADAPPVPAEARDRGDLETFKHPRGSTMAVADPLVRAALKVLADAWPGRLSFDALRSAAWQRLGMGAGQPDAAGERKLAAFLLQGWFTGMVELSARPAGWATDLSDRPAARRLARLQAETDETVTTLRHQNLKLNRTARHLVRLLDGTRDRAAVLAEIERTILDGARAIGGTVEFTPQDRARLAKNLEQDLRRFVAEGLMAG